MEGGSSFAKRLQWNDGVCRSVCDELKGFAVTQEGLTECTVEDELTKFQNEGNEESNKQQLLKPQWLFTQMVQEEERIMTPVWKHYYLFWFLKWGNRGTDKEINLNSALFASSGL